MSATGSHLLSSIARDLHYSLRTLRKTPAFAAGVIITVALTVCWSAPKWRSRWSCSP
jgi:hypothetical protein